MTDFTRALFDLEYALQDIKLLYLEALASCPVNPELLKNPDTRRRLFTYETDPETLLVQGTPLGKAASLFCGSVYLGGKGVLSGETHPLFVMDNELRERRRETLDRVGWCNGVLRDSMRERLLAAKEPFPLFLQLYSEYCITKLSVHELLVDLRGFFLQDHCGDLFVEWLSGFRNSTPACGPGAFREALVIMLRFGKQPHLLLDGDAGIQDSEIDAFEKDAVGMSFEAMCADERTDRLCRRILCNYRDAGRTAQGMLITQVLSRSMTWNKYAMCAFDTGPVFLRKGLQLATPVWSSLVQGPGRAGKPLDMKGLERRLGSFFHIISETYQVYSDKLEDWQDPEARAAAVVSLSRERQRLSDLYDAVVPPENQ